VDAGEVVVVDLMGFIGVVDGVVVAVVLPTHPTMKPGLP
jgi:hypothetical protein